MDACVKWFEQCEIAQVYLTFKDNLKLLKGNGLFPPSDKRQAILYWGYSQITLCRLLFGGDRP